MSGPNLYFEETFKKEKKFRYCLKFLQVSDGELTIPSKQSSDIWLNMKNETNNKVQLLESEKKNLRDHLDFVIKKLEKLHKNLMWNIHLGQAAILSSDLTATPGGETNIALLPGKFNLKNPKTWSKSTLELMDSDLKQMEFDADGIVSVFAVEDTEGVRAGASMEEVREAGLEHLTAVFGQRVWREGRGRKYFSQRKSQPAGQVVFLAYKLTSSVSTGQILLETLVLGVDLRAKKQELYQHLHTLGFTAYTEEKLRRAVELLPLSLTRDQVRLYQSLLAWSRQKMVNITLVNCQRKLSSVARRECLCYSRDK